MGQSIFRRRGTRVAQSTWQRTRVWNTKEASVLAGWGTQRHQELRDRHRQTAGWTGTKGLFFWSVRTAAVCKRTPAGTGWDAGTAEMGWKRWQGQENPQDHSL